MGLGLATLMTPSAERCLSPSRTLWVYFSPRKPPGPPRSLGASLRPARPLAVIGGRVPSARASSLARLETSHCCGALSVPSVAGGLMGEGPSARHGGDIESWFQSAVGSLVRAPHQMPDFAMEPQLESASLSPISAGTGVLALSGGHPVAGQLCWLKYPTSHSALRGF